MKKVIISIVLVLAVALVTVACGSVPAKNEGASVEKSEPATQEQTTADKSVELSEKDKQVSEKDLDELFKLLPDANPEIAEIVNEISNASRIYDLVALSPRVDEVLKKARSSMEEFSTKIAELPSVVDLKGSKIRKEYFVFLSEFHSLSLEVIDKYVKFLREIGQILKDLNYDINDDKNKNFIEELDKILDEWVGKQAEKNLQKIYEKMEEKYGVTRENWNEFFNLEEQPKKQKEIEINDKTSPEEQKE